MLRIMYNMKAVPFPKWQQTEMNRATKNRQKDYVRNPRKRQPNPRRLAHRHRKTALCPSEWQPSDGKEYSTREESNVRRENRSYSDDSHYGIFLFRQIAVNIPRDRALFFCDGEYRGVPHKSFLTVLVPFHFSLCLNYRNVPCEGEVGRGGTPVCTPPPAWHLCTVCKIKKR